MELIGFTKTDKLKRKIWKWLLDLIILIFGTLAIFITVFMFIVWMFSQFCKSF